MKYKFVSVLEGKFGGVFEPTIGCIPPDPANTDYRQFKIDVADGEPLEDPDGNVMTQEEVNAFLAELP